MKVYLILLEASVVLIIFVVVVVVNAKTTPNTVDVEIGLWCS